MQKENILIVDDSLEMLEVIHRQLNALNYYTFQAANVNDAIDILKITSIDLVITDLQMPEIDGMQLVNYSTEHFPETPILVITGYPSISGAIEAVRSGVLDYLVKPFTQQELKSAVDKIFEKINNKNPGINEKNIGVNQSINPNIGIIGHSDKIQKLTEIVHRVKDTKATVLVQGESGTGKELVARAIHYTSKFANKPFITVNCGGIPENLLESELFGFVKGSFTGANETRAGFFQAADGGTIFLDEIGNASLTVQSRLLRVIQEKEIMMIGSTKVQKVDIRIIAATNANLLDLVAKGTFREDLYYRLNVINIEMPPLRDRKDDLPLLVRYFIRKYSDEFNKFKVSISEKAMEVILRYAWIGNIRELENVIQRAILMCDAEIDVQHLPDSMKIAEPSVDIESVLNKPLKEIEKEHILKVLKFVNNNKTKAAEILGIDRKTLRQKLQ